MTLSRFLSSVLVLTFVLLQPLYASAAEEGKFHLVYLVSAVDLKPGSKVFVDPIFFTNGKEVKNFHDYCRKKEQFMNPKQIVGDFTFIDDYCAKKTFTFSPKGYAILNNHGEQLALEPIEFKVFGEVTIPPDVEHRSDPEIRDRVMMGQAKIASSVPGSIATPRWQRNDGAPEYFFLMSQDKQILEKIVPVSRAVQSVVDTLARRAVEFSKIAQGRVSGTRIEARDIEKAKVCIGPNSVKEFRLFNPLFIDLDLDAKLDVLVRAYSVHRIESEPDEFLVACFTNYEILGNGGTKLSGNVSEALTPRARDNVAGGTYQRYLRNGYPIHADLIAVRLAEQSTNCNYVLKYFASSEFAYPEGYTLNSFSCKKSKTILKHVHPSHGKPYHTFNGKRRFELFPT